MKMTFFSLSMLPVAFEAETGRHRTVTVRSPGAMLLSRYTRQRKYLPFSDHR